MPFTDDDLKRLKEGISGPFAYDLTVDEINALLARLEAAEAIVELSIEKRECGNMLGETNTIYDAELNWRATAGKESR